MSRIETETKPRITTGKRPESIYESSMEAAEAGRPGPRANRRATRRGAALQRPRGPLKYQAPDVVEVEGADEANAGAQSEAQRSDSADARAEAVAETDTQGFEKPLVYGSVDL